MREGDRGRGRRFASTFVRGQGDEARGPPRGADNGFSADTVPAKDEKLQEDATRDSARPELIFVKNGKDGHGRARVAGGRLHVKASTPPCTPHLLPGPPSVDGSWRGGGTSPGVAPQRRGRVPRHDGVQ